MAIIIVILIIAIIIIYCRKKYKQNFFSSLVRDEEKNAEDLTGTWFLVAGEENQKQKDCYMTLNKDGTFFASVQASKEGKDAITMKGTYIVNKDNNQSIMQSNAKNPENYLWYQVVVNITERNSNDIDSKLAYGIGINKNNTKEMLQCALNAEEVCRWNNIPF